MAEKCTLLKNSSVLPSSQKFLTQERLCSLDFNNDESLKKIRYLNVHNAYECDKVSIKIIKPWDKSLIKSYTILFQKSLKSPHYPDIWKNRCIMPLHKKSDKQIIRNHQPFSLLPVFGKIFEKVVYPKHLRRFRITIFFRYLNL